MARMASLATLVLLAACSSYTAVLPQPSLLYEEPYEIAFAAAVEAAEAAHLREGLALPVTEANPRSGVVQLRGDPLHQGVIHSVSVVVATDAGARTVVVVRSGTNGPSDRNVAAEVAARVIDEIDARLTRVSR